MEQLIQIVIKQLVYSELTKHQHVKILKKKNKSEESEESEEEELDEDDPYEEKKVIKCV